MEFITCLLLIPLAMGSIWTYVSGVRHHLKIRLLPDFSTSFLIALVLQGVTSPKCQDDVRLPISLHVLQLMFDALLPVTHTHNATMFRSILALAFFTLLQLGELTNSQHIIHMENIQMEREAITIKLLASKCHNMKFPQLIRVWSQP